MPEKGMRILFLTPAFPPFAGGGERFAGSLAKNLIALGHQVTVLTSQAQSEAELWLGSSKSSRIEGNEDGVRIIRCPIAGMPGKWPGLTFWRKAMVLVSGLPGDQSPLLFSMTRYIPPISGLEEQISELGGDFDLIHAFNISWEHPMAIAWREASHRHKPLIITPFVHLGSAKGDRVARNSTMDHQRRMLADAQAVLALTDIEKQGLVEYGIAPDQIAVIGSGLDPLPTFAAPESTRAHFRLTKPFALFIGRLNKDKGAIDAARATLKLISQGSDICLTLVGRISKEFEDYYQGLTKEEKQQIRLLGTISESEKHGLLEACQMLLLPSRTDSFGIVLLEAWAHGKPVIGARAGGIPGVIEDGKTGFLVEYGDVSALSERMNQLLINKKISGSMGEAGRLLVEKKYTWGKVTSQVVDSYQRVLVK